jgi:hypothetical protein
MYISRKKAENKEGYQDLVKPNVKAALGEQTTQYIRDTATLFNPIMNIVDPSLKKTQAGTNFAKDIQSATRSLHAKPLDPTFVLGSSDTEVLSTNLGSDNRVSKALNMCETVTTLDCDKFDNPEFVNSCGICHKDGINSQNQNIIGGLYISEDDRINAELMARRLGSKKPNYKPTIGSCAPGQFTVTKKQCIHLKKKAACEANRSFASGCSQCYQDESFSYVSEDALTVAPSLTVAGFGSLRIQMEGASPFDKTILLSAKGEQVVIPGFLEGTSITLTVKDVTGMGTVLAGYLEGPTGTGVFTFDIANLIRTDKITNRRPIIARSLVIKDAPYNVLRPGAGQREMQFVLTNVFTFLEPSEESVQQCLSAPFITKPESATTLQSGPCFVRGSAPGNYSADCLQGIFTDAGCTTNGTGFPTTADKMANLMNSENGRKRKLGEIVEYVQEMSVRAATGKTSAGVNLSISDWDNASKFCTGKTVTGP